jgi:hypothetical protein
VSEFEMHSVLIMDGSDHSTKCSGQASNCLWLAAAAKPPLVPVQPNPASAPKVVTASAPSQLGAAILAARTVAGLSQTELAAKREAAKANIARLEKAGSNPSTNTLQTRFAKTPGHKLTITFTRKA